MKPGTKIIISQKTIHGKLRMNAKRNTRELCIQAGDTGQIIKKLAKDFYLVRMDLNRAILSAFRDEFILDYSEEK